MSENSGIETPAAPEWLSKLEKRREMLTHSKLGHEVGAGAPCSECGDKCPGLDLHFWRKVCRNCKCRKDQHMCADDDLSGWAQFEILGQIRSKPAFIKIKALASQPVQLEWVPPNAAPDIISDYMEKLGTKQIPVAGSQAAQKRKQQLEFQVPPHDLDAALCDNLSETEANQLQLYVQRVLENCVGQGNVVRVGNVNYAKVGLVTEQQQQQQRTELPTMASALEDSVLGEIMSNEKLQKALTPNVNGKSLNEPSKEVNLFVAFSTPICEKLPIEEEAAFSNLSPTTRQLLRGLNKQALHSFVQHAPIYDKIITTLQDRNLDVSRDPRLGPISDFLKQYENNARVHQEVDALLNSPLSPHRTPLKNAKLNELTFSSPLPLKTAVQARISAQMQQDTPMRKVRVIGSLNNVLNACGLPQQIDYTRDPFFAELLTSEPLKQALENVGNQQQQQLVISSKPINTTDIKEDLILSDVAKEQIQDKGINGKALQSLLVNQPYYNILFDTLTHKGIDVSQCKLLSPLQELRVELQKNLPLRGKLSDWLRKQPDNRLIAYETPKSSLSTSNSSDSGFESKPTTPKNNDLTATHGRFASIPGIEDLPMYPTVEASPSSSSHHDLLPETLQKLHLMPAPELICRDCDLVIGFGEVAVKAERAGLGIAWHPDCFKCHTCRELLADLVYFFHNGQVYCGRDLAIKLKIPRCKACDELIFTKEYTAAEGASFHIKHFCCYHCDMPLAGQQYLPDEKTNMPLCLKCYEQYFAAACQHCGLAIGPSDQGVALGEIHWHGSCFLCAGLNCGKSLIGGRFCIKQKMPFCSPNCVRSIIH